LALKTRIATAAPPRAPAIEPIATRLVTLLSATLMALSFQNLLSKRGFKTKNALRCPTHAAARSGGRVGWFVGIVRA
jgi:hypothetical protein